MGGLSLTHLLLFAVVLLIFFGPSRLPSLGQSLGKAIKGFKDGLNEIDVEAKDITQTQLEKNQQGNTQVQTQAQKEKQNQDS